MPLSQVHKAQNVASKRGKLLTEDFLYLIRKVHSLTPHLIALLICSAAHILVLFLGFTKTAPCY